MAGTAAVHDERRRFIRHPAGIPLRCRRVHHLPADDYELHDISLGGLRFSAPVPFEPGDVIEVEFPTLPQGGMLNGEVVWVCAVTSPSGTRYDTGMRFLHEDMRVKARILEQVCRIEAYREAQARRRGRHLTRQQAAVEWIAHHAADFSG